MYQEYIIVSCDINSMFLSLTPSHSLSHSVSLQTNEITQFSTFKIEKKNKKLYKENKKH